MKHNIFLIGMLLIFCNLLSAQQGNEPWSHDQLLEPSILASRIAQNQTDSLLILSIGPGAVIKGSIDMGPSQNEANLEKLKNYLKNIPKDQEVVIYCGCCPFDKCPNIRPAFQLLKNVGLEHPKLLHLSQNIKVDWLEHGYPTQE